MGDDRRRALQRAAPSRASAARAAGRRAAGRARSGRRRPRPRRSRRRRSPTQPTSRRPRPFVPARDLEQAGAVAAAQARSPSGDVEQRAGGVVGARAAQQPLAADDHDVLAVAAARRRRAPRLLGRAGGLGQLVETSPPPPSAAFSAARNASPAPGAKRATAAALASSDDGRLVATASLTRLRRTPLRMRRSRIGMSSTGSASSTSTAWANSRSGTVACSDGVAERGAQLAPTGRRRRATRRRPSRAPRARAGRGEALLVGRLAAGERARPCPSARPQRRRGLVERALPADRAQLAAVADHRRGDALVDVDRLVGEAALVAQPAVVDVVVVAREDAQDAVVADGEGDVALRRAQRADRAGLSMSHGRARKR